MKGHYRSRTGLLGLLFLLSPSLSWARQVPVEEPPGFNPGVLVAIAIVILLLVAIPIVIKYMQSLERVEARNRIKAASGDLHSAIRNEIEILPGSEEQREQVAEVLTQVIQKQVDKQVTEVKQKYVTEIVKKDTEVKEVTRKYKNTLAEKQQTESVIRSVAQGVVILNKRGEVVMLNPAAEKLLSKDRKEQIGQPLQQGSEALVSIVKQEGALGEREIEISSADEETKKILRSSTAVIENEDGETIGMVSVLSDVTKQKELDRMKSHFVSSVSHELRTPIVAIRNSISLMLTETPGPVTEEQKKFLGIAKRNLERLNKLIDDLLDLSKMEAKKMEITPKPSSIERAVNETCDTVETWAKSKEISLARKVDKGIPKISFDHDRIIQVLTNLIGNAIKFTPKKGTITVSARMAPEKNEVLISVADTGEGIAKEDLPKVFNKFQQVGNRAASDISGTGLGLAIAKELVELHGGSIWVESTVGKGTIFTFSLPAPTEEAG